MVAACRRVATQAVLAETAGAAVVRCLLGVVNPSSSYATLS